ncbi:hypothetical protein VB620_01360 [Nodularia harveyana UHCC-0300]|uniref:Uncharacterized protein n=1 Tax=Nodularia harveyana UHCC-0300 TaxID=2974287 RepID=A0ABU5U8W5_9CYAN|nr:hypothetical protein [Nodularia harveyana]MEA5579985.1 hypothetical protein [Nodularia harveyana UHCC-0300]
MGRWTPLILMSGGLAILMGTLLGINFPIGGQQVSQNDDNPEGRTSRVLPANINVNSSSGSKGNGNNTASDNRGSVAQENFSTSDDNTSVAQNNNSSSPGDSTSDTGFQSDTIDQDREPIRALW